MHKSSRLVQLLLSGRIRRKSYRKRRLRRPRRVPQLGGRALRRKCRMCQHARQLLLPMSCWFYWQPENQMRRYDKIISVFCISIVSFHSLIPPADIDECPNVCGANSLCLNTVGSYSCQCKDGFVGNAFLSAGCTGTYQSTKF